MFSQLKEEICDVGGKGFWAIPIKDCDRRTSVDNGIPKVNFGRREVKNGGDAEGDETKGLKVRE